MADGSTTLLYRFLGIDAGAGAQFTRMSAKTAELGAASKTTGGLVSSLAKTAALAGVAIGAGAVKMASDYQKSMTLIQTQAGASKREVESFSKSLLTLAPQVAQSPEDLSVSLYHVYSALKKVGADGPQMLHAVKIAAEGAKVGNTDLEDTTNSLTATLASGIVKFNEAGKAMGYLNATVGAGDMHFSDLNQALGTGLLVTMKTFGVSMRDTGAALAVFGDNNIRGADAATKLRMAVQDLVKPAANSDEVLGSVGLTADQLRQTLQNKGLNGALQLLREKLDAAGITGRKVGGFLEDAFTKKAGAGLAILITRLEQFDEARRTEEEQARGFGDAWHATTQTLAFQFDRLKAEAESFMITIGQHLLPAVTEAAQWLGTNLPHAVHTLADILGPTVHLVGDGLGHAWHIVVDVLKIAAGALSAIGGFLKDNKSLVTALTITLGGLWAAVKLIALGKAIFAALSTALDGVALKAMYAGDAMRTMSAAAFGAKTATIGLTAVATGLIMAWQQQKELAANVKAAVEGFSQALDQDSQAIGRNVRAMAEKNIIDAGANDIARRYGVSQKLLTDASVAQGAEFMRLAQRVNEVAKSHGADSDALFALNKAIFGNRRLLGTAIQDNKDMAEATGKSTGAIHRNVDAVSTLAGGTQNLTGETKDNNNATVTLTDSIKKLTNEYQKLINTELSQTQSQLAYKQGLFGLKQQVKDYGTSLSNATAKGVQNRSNLISLLQSAEQAAEGAKNYGKALDGNIQDFITFATKAGFSKKQVDNLLHSLHLMPGHIETRFNLANYAQIHKQLETVQTQLNNLPSTINIGVHYGVTGGHTLPDSGGRGFSRALDPGVILDSLRHGVETARAALKKALDGLRSDLQSRRQAIGQLAGSLSSSADLGGLFGTDENGNPTTANVNTFLNSQASQLKKFAHDLRWGEKHGMGGLLLSQIAQLGPVQGEQVLQQFMSGAASIVQANRAERAISQFSHAAAGTVEDRVYMRRLAEDRKEAHERTQDLKAIRRALEEERRHPTGGGRPIGSSITVNVRARETYDRHAIDQIIKGIRREQRVAGTRLI